MLFAIGLIVSDRISNTGRSKGTSKMKFIKFGYAWDTDASTMIGRRNQSTLYKTEHNRYFIVDVTTDDEEVCTPLRPEDALRLAEEFDLPTESILKHFGNLVKDA